MTYFLDKNTDPVVFGTLPIDNPSVAILLCTYNGARFLGEQLDSIEAQTHQNWVVICSDDGSTDQTIEILLQYQAKWPSGKLTIRTGPQKGFCKNFQFLVSDDSISADFYAFCDQDDVWLPEKLAKALDALKNISGKVPSVYGARTQSIDEHGAFLGLSPIFSLCPSFENALVQSIAGGNTMVFCRAAKQAIQIDTKYDIVSHDWWTYLVVTAIGGQFIYDPIPTTYYRQHKANIIGSKKGFFEKFARLRSLLSGKLQHWIESRNDALESIVQNLTEKNQQTFRQFCHYRRAPLFSRVLGIKRLGIHRQHISENIGFYIAVLLKKI